MKFLDRQGSRVIFKEVRLPSRRCFFSGLIIDRGLRKGFCKKISFFGLKTEKVGFLLDAVEAIEVTSFANSDTNHYDDSATSYYVATLHFTKGYRLPPFWDINCGDLTAQESNMLAAGFGRLIGVRVYTCDDVVRATERRLAAPKARFALPGTANLVYWGSS